ncbi:MAG: hypothetical protein WCJ29_04665 [bacterium]
MKSIIIGIIAIAIIVGAGFWVSGRYNQALTVVQEDLSVQVKNGTYIIDGEKVVLNNGLDAKSVTKYFGNQVVCDTSGSGFNDIYFILTQTPGGSGTFYYLASAVGKMEGPVGGPTILLGDRISPQTTECKDGLVVVNYADRKQDEPFSEVPSVGVSRYFKLQNNNLVEAFPNK